MLYAIIATDIPNSLDLRRSTRPKHLEYLKGLIDAGRVEIAGPHPAIDSPDPGPAGFSGSLIIAEFASLEAAQQWAAKDPYAVAGVFGDVVVKPFLRVTP
jgi:uncharacterized protein YciI